MPSTSGPANPRKTVAPVRPESDKLDELERAVRARQKSEPPEPGPSSFPVKGEATIPGLRAKWSLDPSKLRTFLVTALAAVGIVGVPSGVVAWWGALRAGHRELVETQAAQSIQADQITTMQATLKSHERRLRVCEASQPMVVSGAR
jgi:hypothetical protein